MKYAIVNLLWAKSHGIEILPEMRTSTDQSKVILHEEMLSPFNGEDFPRYTFGDPAFIELLNSKEWTYPEGEEPVINRQFSRLLALNKLDQEATKEINTYNLSAKEALQVVEYFPEWRAEIDVKAGERYRVADALYECDQDHTTQDNWKPGQGAHSLWHEVTEEHAGTKDDPIPYNEDHDPLFPGMVLELGKYYTQGGVVYKCTRNSDIAVVQNLAALIGHYVELA